MFLYVVIDMFKIDSTLKNQRYYREFYIYVVLCDK